MRLHIFCYLFSLSLLTVQAGNHSLLAKVTRSLKSLHGTYLGVYEHGEEWVIDLTAHNKSCEQWSIEDHGGPVALSPYCAPSKYLSTNQEGSVKLVDSMRTSEMWTPIKNYDGSWSFENAKSGGWLIGYASGLVSSVRHFTGSNKGFWLEYDTGATRVEDHSSHLTMEVPDSSENSDSEDIDHNSTLNGSSSSPFPNISNKTIVFDENLAIELVGQRCLKSVHSTYLRAWRGIFGEEPWRVDMAQHCKYCEYWNIEERHGKVALRANCGSEFLRGKPDGSVDLSDSREFWTPFKNEDGSLSLRSVHGSWLRAQAHGRVSLQDHRDAEETFRIDSPTSGSTTADDSDESEIYNREEKFRHQSPSEEDSEEEEEDEVITSSTARALSTATLFTFITTSTIPTSTTMTNHILKEENGDPRHSAAMAGLHCVRGVHRMYLRASNDSSSVDMAPYGKGCTHLWTIEDHNGKVALKATEAGLFLCANPDGKVDLAEWGIEGVLWTPFKNEDTWSPVNRREPWGTWSLKSIHGTWLRGHAHGAVSLKDHLMSDEKFRLESDGDSELEANRSTESSTTTVSSLSMEEKKEDPRHSAELAGQHCVRGVHWMYLRVTKGTESSVDMAPYGHECEYPWNIEDHNGKVALKAENRITFLRANQDGSVDLAEWGKDGVLWTPFKNDDGSWSLRSVYGTWLRAQPGHGRVSLQEHRKADEHFWIESWKDATHATSTANHQPLSGEDEWPAMIAVDHSQSEQHNFSVSLIIAILLLFIAVLSAFIYTAFYVRRLIIQKGKSTSDRLFLVRYLVDEDVELRDNYTRSHYYAEEP